MLPSILTSEPAEEEVVIGAGQDGQDILHVLPELRAERGETRVGRAPQCPTAAGDGLVPAGLRSPPALRKQGGPPVLGQPRPGSSHNSSFPPFGKWDNNDAQKDEV